MLKLIEPREANLTVVSKTRADKRATAVAYIMKGYPRRSEPFISNEVYLLEQMGVTIDIFALKGLSEDRNYPPVNQVHAHVTYLPELESPEGQTLIEWLRQNLGRYLASQWGVLIRRPVAYLTTLTLAIYLSWRYRQRSESWYSLPRPKRVFVKDFLRAVFIAREILDRPQIGHLHGHFCHGSTTMAMFASMLSGRPFSFTAHAKDIYLKRLNPGDLLQRKMQRASFVVTCTDANRQHLQGIDRSLDHIHTIYHGLDLSAFVPPIPARTQRSVPVILSVGRFVPKKGFPYLVEACKILRDRGVPFACQLVGSPDSDLSVLQDLITRYALSDQLTIGASVTQIELRNLYQAADIFVLPCVIAEDGDRDGIPNVLAEAMATELAVVSTDVSGIPEIVKHDENGMLIPPRDGAALADALQTLLGDFTRRQSLGAAARQTICRVFDSKQTTVHLFEMFRESLERQREVIR